MVTSVELFAGAGGLAIGLSRAGFKHVAVIERDPVACETIRENKRRRVAPAIDWPLLEADVDAVDFGRLKGADFVAGGPPCQPFAMSGNRRAHGDERNMFPAMMRAVHELSPLAVLIENVPGLVRGRLKKYFDYIRFQLQFPATEMKRGEAWPSHLVRLRNQRSRPLGSALSYTVHASVLQAADFGVPQRRERVFIVAFRSDLDSAWTFPTATHSFDRLLWDQWISGEYWDVHSLPKRLRPTLREYYRQRVNRLRAGNRPLLERWQTVRDALVGLPAPARQGDPEVVANHTLWPGARVYERHTGSPLDMPAKTLKAGSHGVPGGENILVRPDGSIRYFTIRECARLQTFPDDYAFVGTWKSLVRQVGNAAPVLVVERLARSIGEHLVASEVPSAVARSVARKQFYGVGARIPAAGEVQNRGFGRSPRGNGLDG